MLFYVILILKTSLVLSKRADPTAAPQLFKDLIRPKESRISDYVFWPNATIPFYINEENFDAEQVSAILKALHAFTAATCLKFVPVVAAPSKKHVVMVFQNPEGEKLCNIKEMGQPREESFVINLGYKCLMSPRMESIIMRALGFPFEHNRVIRTLYVDVQKENIMQEYLRLFEKEQKLPPELSNLPYDFASVTHFGEFEYTKNGHKTIVVLNKNNQKFPNSRRSLSKLDKRKIEIVYGPECRKRERKEKIEVCRNYPQQDASKSSRKKRSVENEGNNNTTTSTATTPQTSSTTAPLEDKNISNDTFDIEDMPNEVKSIIKSTSKLLEGAIKHARSKYCNDSEPYEKPNNTNAINFNETHVVALNFLDYISQQIQLTVAEQLKNVTQFCEESNTKLALRNQCNNFADPRCRQKYYHSTKTYRGFVTKVKSNYVPSTKYPATINKYANLYGRRKREITFNETTDNPQQNPVTWTKVVNVIDNKTEDIKENGIKWKYDTDRRQANSPYLEPYKRNSAEQMPLYEQSNKNRFVTIKNPSFPETANQQPDIEESEFNKEKNRFKIAKDSKPLGNNDDQEHPIPSEKQPPLRDDDLGERSASKSAESTSYKKKKRKSKKTKNRSAERKPQSNSESRENKKSGKKRQVKGKRPVSSEESGSEKAKASKHVVFIPDMDDLPEFVKLSKKLQEFYNDRKWPTGVVPYFIKEDDNFDIENLRSNLEEVNAILKEKTCVRLKEIGEGDLKNYKDYLVLDSKHPDFVTGRVGGKQIFGCVELFQSGQHRQFTAMMVMSMLGFYFEVSRSDRDKYIRVHQRHIRPDKLHHFEKIRGDAALPLPYDYYSATHPAWQFWRKIGKTGISTVATYKSMDPEGTIMKKLGQNDNLLSKIDIVKINSVYGRKCFAPSSKKRKARSKKESNSSE